MNRPTYIYALCCPDTGEVRYVGKTVNPIEQRLKNHLLDKSKTYKTNWIKSVLKKYNKQPQVKILEVVPPGDDWIKVEQYWIAYFKKFSNKLCNVTIGGEGLCGHTHSLESKLKISKSHSGSNNPMYGKPAHNRGKTHSKEARLKMCGKRAPMWEGKIHPFLGKRHTPDALVKISQASKNISEETRRKRSIALSGKNNPMYGVPSPMTGRKLTPEQCLKISTSKQGWHPSPEHFEKFQKGRLNRVYSTEELEKRSKAMTGENNPMYGKPGTWAGKKMPERSAESRARYAEAARQPRSLESRKKQSETLKAKWKVKKLEQLDA